MKTHRTVFLVMGLCLVLAGPMLANVFDMPGGQTNLQFVTIGALGNRDDINGAGYGAVDHWYDIGKYEVTAGQYTEFLNAVAADDVYALYNTNMSASEFGCKIERTGPAGSYAYSVAPDHADRPVNFVSWADAARFANWLHNAQPTGPQGLATTEDGAYYLNGAVTEPALQAVTREASAVFFIPGEDEWYKAAYFEPDYNGTVIYYDYATTTNSQQSNVVVDPDPGSNANFFRNGWAEGAPYYTTEVGEFENSQSPWDTFDQGGNVWEWNEDVTGANRIIRGGSFGYTHGDSAYYMLSSMRRSGAATFEDEYTGFRMAAIPEPATMSLLALGWLAVLRRRRG